MKKGFTLVEVLVTSIILGFVLTGVGMFLIMTARISEQANVDVRSQNNLNLVFNNIANEVLVAKTVNASKSNKDSLYITKTDDSKIIYLFDRTNKKIRKKIGSGAFKDLTLVTTNGQTNVLNCDFVNDSGFPNEVVIIENLSSLVTVNGKSKKTEVTSVALSCRNKFN